MNINFKRSVAIVSVAVLAVSALALTLTSTSAIEFPENNTVTFGGDASYVGNGLNPRTVAWGQINRFQNMVYMHCFLYNDEQGKFQPWLAKPSESGWINDGQTYELKIFEDAEWWDGDPVTAEDVEFSFENNVTYPPDSALVEDVVAEDEHTVHIEMKEGAAHNLQINLQLTNVPICKKEIWKSKLEAGEGDVVWNKPDKIVGNGPYKPTKMTSDVFVLERVEDWWGQDHVDKEFYGDYNPKYLILRSGTNPALQRAFKGKNYDVVDGAFQNPPAFMAQNSDWARSWDTTDTNNDGAVFGSGAWIGMVPVLDPAPENANNIILHPWFRRALAYAIPYSDIVNMANYGLTPRNTPALFPMSLPFSKDYLNTEVINNTFQTVETPGGYPVIKENKQKAIEILKEHCEGSVEEGWTYNGEPIGRLMITSVTGWTDVNTMARLTAGAWKSIGLEGARANIVGWGKLGSLRQGHKCEFWDFAWTPAPGSMSPLWSLEKQLGQDRGGEWNDWEEYAPTEESGNALALEIEDMLNNAWAKPIGSDESIEIVKNMQEKYVPRLPYLPMYGQSTWMRWNTNEWVGFPTIDNPYCSPESYNVQSEPVFLGHIHRAEEEPTGAEEEEPTGGVSTTMVVAAMVVTIVVVLGGVYAITKRE